MLKKGCLLTVMVLLIGVAALSYYVPSIFPRGWGVRSLPVEFIVRDVWLVGRVVRLTNAGGDALRDIELICERDSGKKRTVIQMVWEPGETITVRGPTGGEWKKGDRLRILAPGHWPKSFDL
jgi:hypothetical protein